MNNIRYFREKTGLTQGQLAEKLGIALDSVSRYENGKREPRASDLCRMADVFNCSIDDLLRSNNVNPTQPLSEAAAEQGEKAAV